MKILTILGSPNKNGKTAHALSLFEKKMQLKGDEIERVNVAELKINGCTGCYACMSKKDEPGCVQEDDALPVLRKILSADAVVYSSPVYCYEFTAQLKTLIDRHLCLIDKPLLDGKKVALLVTCAGDEENNADLVKQIFRRDFDGKNGLIRAKILGEYILAESDAPDFAERAEKTASRMASEISA
ncbi:MAG: flavodoxin family protein [Bacillota bacterium]|nr:flavodoxin family protein [Bacillota bacterium]